MVARAMARGELREDDALLFAESVAMFLWGLSVVGRHDDEPPAPGAPTPSSGCCATR